MKKILTFIVLAPLLLITLNGCGLFGDDEGDKEFTPATAQEQLDASTVVKAVELKNLELCGTIENKAQKDSCLTKVADQLVLDEAVADADADKCGDIAEKLTKEKCVLLAEEAFTKTNYQEVVTEQQGEIESIVEAGDISGCAALADPNFKKQCETNIYLDQARETMDAAPCENIEEDFIRESCIDMVSEDNTVLLEEEGDPPPEL